MTFLYALLIWLVGSTLGFIYLLVAQASDNPILTNNARCKFWIIIFVVLSVTILTALASCTT